MQLSEYVVLVLVGIRMFDNYMKDRGQTSTSTLCCNYVFIRANFLYGLLLFNKTIFHVTAHNITYGYMAYFALEGHFNNPLYY